MIDQLTKMIYYKSVKVSNNDLGLVEVIINIMVKVHGLPNSIVNN